MKMRQILKLIFGIVLYLLELALNLNAFFQHTSGCCSFIWWILPILIFATFLVNIVTILNRRGKISFGWYGVAFLLQIGVVLRYFEEWRMLDEDIENDKKSRKLLRVRFTQALFNSGPQCILHGYILMETWDFPAYIAVSLVVSFMSLVWGLYSFPLTHPDLSNFRTSVLVIFKLGFIISRLVLLSFFLYLFGALLPALFTPRILVLCCYLCVKLWNYCGDIESFAFSVWNFTITVLASVFDITACFHGYGWMAGYHFVESAVFFCVGMPAEPEFHSNSDHIDTLRFLIRVVALGGFGVGCVFCCLASCFTDYDDSGVVSLCYMYKRVKTSSEAPSNSLCQRTYAHTSTNPTVQRTYAHTSTNVPDRPSRFSSTAFVVKKQHIVVQGPTHAAVLERTEIYGIERC